MLKSKPSRAEKEMKYSLELFIHNIQYLVKYRWEPEIKIYLKNDKTIFIIAYEDFIDFYDENDNYQKLDNIKAIIGKIDFEQVVSIVDDIDIDHSRPIEDQSSIVDGKLWV